MFYLILFIVGISFTAVPAYVLIEFFIVHGFNRDRMRRCKVTLIIAIVLVIINIVLSVISFNKYKQYVQSDAIDHYVVGDVQCREVLLDGEVIDWTYIVLPNDYE